MEKQYQYSSPGERFCSEWKIYVLAFVFIVIADSIGQINIPLGAGRFILFPIFYSLILASFPVPRLQKSSAANRSKQHPNW